MDHTIESDKGIVPSNDRSSIRSLSATREMLRDDASAVKRKNCTRVSDAEDSPGVLGIRTVSKLEERGSMSFISDLRMIGASQNEIFFFLKTHATLVLSFHSRTFTLDKIE